ncbi:hypothetical protein O0L34_g5221 [Tuta absoluta]|nr:hypothetical protein O0L34_g5221 [Tuta absoluta]
MRPSLPKHISAELLRTCKKQINNSNLAYITSHNYCDGKSVYQREEEGKKPRMVYGQPYPDWRKPWVQREGEFTTKLAVFNQKNPSPHILNALQKLPYLSFEEIKEWWKDMKVIQEIENQRYMSERVATLGSNLAAIHFFTYRGAAVRLKDSHNWIAGNVEKLQTELPNTYVEGYLVEAVDCTNFHHNGIRYEGLENLAGLNFLKWLSLKNQKYVDVWCLDRLAGQNGTSLEYLDVSSAKLSEGCVYAFARMPALRTVVIADPGDDIQTQAALSFLEQERPNLTIKVTEPVQNDPPAVEQKK